MPEVNFTTEEAMPEEFRATATKNEDGTFTANLSLTTKVDEFRTNNNGLITERDALALTAEKYTALVGDDADAYIANIDALKLVAQKVEDGELKTTDDIEAELAKRLSATNDKNNATLAERDIEIENWQKKAQGFEGQIKQGRVNDVIRAAVLDEKSGAKQEALTDLISRANDVWTTDDNGNPVALNKDGTKIYGDDGVTPLTAAEWLNGLKPTASYYFNDSTGGGADGGKAKTNNGGVPDMTGWSTDRRLRWANEQAGL